MSSYRSQPEAVYVVVLLVKRRRTHPHTPTHTSVDRSIRQTNVQQSSSPSSHSCCVHPGVLCAARTSVLILRSATSSVRCLPQPGVSVFLCACSASSVTLVHEHSASTSAELVPKSSLQTLSTRSHIHIYTYTHT